MMKVLKLLMIGLLLLISVGYAIAILDLAPEILAFPSSVKAFFYGGLGFLLFWFLFKKRFMYAFSVFEHELTHVLMARLFFLKTLRFEVSPRKHVAGQVVVGVDADRGVRRVASVFFSLAPYFLPTLTLLVFATYPILGTRILPLFFFFVGFTAFYHLLTTFREFGFHQADIQRHGEYFSTAFVISGNIIFFGMILVVVVLGFSNVPGFLLNGLLNVFGRGF